MTPLPPGGPFKCPRRVGFLFSHACPRDTPLGCPDCQNGQVEDPYSARDRYDYSGYDSYDDGYYNTGYLAGYQSMGTTYAGPPDAPQGDSSAMDFTEADRTDLVKPDQDSDFENDLNAS